MTVDWDALSARASMASHRLIGWIYWDPYGVEAYEALGLPSGGTYYINTRCAPLADAGPQVVAAACYSILPAFIEASMGLVAGRTTFDELRQLRDAAVARGLREYVPEICDGLAELAAPLWSVADALPLSGRPMFAAHRQSPRPDDGALSGWLAVNCIREWRGDTHFAVLLAADVSAVQAGILHNAYLNYPPEWIPRSRGADDVSLAAAMTDLEERGLASDGVVSETGRQLREDIETQTDHLCRRPWQLLGSERTEQLLALVEPVGDRLLARINDTAGTEWMPAARTRRT
ncbi:MAG: SCO6745 family protein [Mycobacteriales bacterium]